MHANFHIERPQPPEFINITYLGTNNSAHYLIEWSLPSNVREFDLNHYEVIVRNKTAIGTKENSVTITIKKEVTVVAVSIIAVDRCGIRSASSSKNITVRYPSLAGTGGLNDGPSTGTANACTCGYGVAVTIIIMVTSLVTFLLVSITISLVIMILWKIIYPGKSAADGMYMYLVLITI